MVKEKKKWSEKNPLLRRWQPHHAESYKLINPFIPLVSSINVESLLSIFPPHPQSTMCWTNNVLSNLLTSMLHSSLSSCYYICCNDYPRHHRYSPAPFYANIILFPIKVYSRSFHARRLWVTIKFLSNKSERVRTMMFISIRSTARY